MSALFETYIGYSGVVVIVGIATALMGYASFDKNGTSESAAGPTMGVVLGAAVAILGALIWIGTWLLEKM